MRAHDPKTLLENACAGDRVALARLISIVEAQNESSTEVAKLVWPLGGKAYTVGITGAPGAGKSTLVDRLVTICRQESERVGVLAIDPSSPYSGGAILGDRVRMDSHFTDTGVFIRSMATRGHLGGLSLAAPGASRVLDAVGYNPVIVETVGVGQVEVEIAGSADTTVVVVNPGWGDGIQANKAGLMEIADIFVINKADRPGVQQSEHDLISMLELGHQLSGWTPTITKCEASNNVGLDQVWQAILVHRDWLNTSGELEIRRAKRIGHELTQTLTFILSQRVTTQFQGKHFDDQVQRILKREVDPLSAARELLA